MPRTTRTKRAHVTAAESRRLLRLFANVGPDSRRQIVSTLEWLAGLERAVRLAGVTR